MSTSQIVTGNTERTRPENRAFYPALDGLRAVALLMVFFQHYSGLPWGWAGVDLFFVLSGFLITGILYDTRNDAYRARNFYIRRTLRIFPLYYGVIFVLLALYPVAHWTISWWWLIWPAYLGNFARFVHPMGADSRLQHLADFQPQLMFHGRKMTLYLGHFWSLCVEEQFYLLWPWVVFGVRDRRKLLWICAATLPICLLMRIAGQHSLPGWMLDAEVLYRATPFRLDALLLGGGMALLLRGPHARQLLKASRIALPLSAVVLLAWCAFTPQRHFRVNPYPYPASMFTWGLTIIDLLAALLILVALQPGSWVYRAFNIAPLRWLGRLSYGAYVLHDVLHTFYGRIAKFLWPAHWWRLTSIVGLAVTIILAWLSFRFVESPFLNLKERWTKHAQD